MFSRPHARLKLYLAATPLVIALLIASEGPKASAAPPGDPVRGQKVLTTQQCLTCHMINGKGMKLAPDLSAIGSKRDATWLAKFLPNPTVLDPSKPPIVKMMPVKVKGQDLDDLIAYLVTLKAKK